MDVASSPSLTASSPVQRSSSLRVSRTKTSVEITKEPSVQRRLSCAPLIFRHSPDNEHKLNLPSEQEHNTTMNIHQAGCDDVEMEEGKVERMRRG